MLDVPLRELMAVESEAKAGPPRGRRLGGSDVSVVLGGPDQALQRGHGECAAHKGPPTPCLATRWCCTATGRTDGE